MSGERYQADYKGDGLEIMIRAANVQASGDVIQAFLRQVDELGDQTNEEYLRITQVRKSGRSVDFFIYDTMRFIIENQEYVSGLVEAFLQYLGGIVAEDGQPVTKEQVEERIMRLSASVHRGFSRISKSRVSRAARLVIPIRKIALGTVKGKIEEARVRFNGKQYIISEDKIPEKVKQELRIEDDREWIRSIWQKYLSR